jgi:hypothetical protein
MVKVKMPVWVKYYLMSLCSFLPSLLTRYQTGFLALAPAAEGHACVP